MCQDKQKYYFSAKVEKHRIIIEQISTVWLDPIHGTLVTIRLIRSFSYIEVGHLLLKLRFDFKIRDTLLTLLSKIWHHKLDTTIPRQFRE